jgi:hypothetical protein
MTHPMAKSEVENDIRETLVDIGLVDKAATVRDKIYILFQKNYQPQFLVGDESERRTEAKTLRRNGTDWWKSRCFVGRTDRRDGSTGTRSRLKPSQKRQA